MKLDVVPPHENFKGLPYGEWVALWNKWLMSEDPDTYDGGDILFLRGNVDYKHVDGLAGGTRFIDPQGIYDRTGEKGEHIFEGTAIFIPIFTFMLVLGDLYDGRVVRKEEELRYLARRDINEGGPMWATIKKKGRKATRIVNNLKDYFAYSPLFRLNVPESSLLRERMELPLEPGVYDAVSAGYFLIIKSLPPSTYRIMFGEKGPGEYYTNSIYDIFVKGKRRDSVKDKSGSMLTFRRLQGMTSLPKQLQ
jgi:hypothetical protein